VGLLILWEEGGVNSSKNEGRRGAFSLRKERKTFTSRREEGVKKRGGVSLLRKGKEKGKKSFPI